MSQKKVTATDSRKERTAMLTPEQAAAMVGSWDTNGDEHTGDLILLCRALTYDPDGAEDILFAIEREKILQSPAVSEALDRIVEQQRRAWQKEVPR